MSVTMNTAWFEAISEVLDAGLICRPRGKVVKEVLHQTHVIDMNYPVLSLAKRKVSYRFMVREAIWILSGSNLLAPLVEVNKRMAEFSDDGVTLAGAYGPRFVEQLPHVVKALAGDSDTRQATLTLWRPSPAPSKDIPCTVAMDFKIRRGLLSCHVFMRSSDLWLGLPYDVFSFTMMAAKVAHQLFLQTGAEARLGDLYLTSASSHIYEEHFQKAEDLFSDEKAWVVPDGPNLGLIMPGLSCFGRPLEFLAVADAQSPEAWLKWGGDHV